MKAPICDFVKKYIKSRYQRLHMPGHKGVRLTGMEKRDLTEIKGADSLYEADGIIKESENMAGEIFGAHTFYSTEGSSQCIRAMIYLVTLYARERGERPLILAGRNAHKTFISAVALCDAEVKWLYPDREESYISCRITPDKLEKALGSVCKTPSCVYITSPDYLGNMCDISALSRVCSAYGTHLIVDNAHGAYLKHLPVSAHPMDLGAAMCCDSAHKTLPALTGGAYLHISKTAPDVFKFNAKRALALFGSTSPSYLILQSLDAVNGYTDTFRKKLHSFIPRAQKYRRELEARGYVFVGDEAIKFTVDAKKYGYTGTDLAELMRSEYKIECEFADPDYTVFMLSPLDNGAYKLYKALLNVPKKEKISDTPPCFLCSLPAVSVRDAMLSPWEKLDIDASYGKTLAESSLSCPPAVPILIPGEVIDANAIAAFKYYGIDNVQVVKE